MREYQAGPYMDNGGLASKSFSVDLDALMRPITWTNGKIDGDETGVDCGGSSPAVDLKPMATSAVNPGNASSHKYLSLMTPHELALVQIFARFAKLEYALHKGQNFATFYSGVEEADRTVEAIAWYVANT